VALRGATLQGIGGNFTFRIVTIYTRSPDIIYMMKSRRLRWAGHMARVGERSGVCWIWWAFRMERYRLEDPGMGGRILLKWPLNWFGGRGLV